MAAAPAPQWWGTDKMSIVEKMKCSCDNKPILGAVYYHKIWIEWPKQKCENASNNENLNVTKTRDKAIDLPFKRMKTQTNKKMIHHHHHRHHRHHANRAQPKVTSCVIWCWSQPRSVTVANFSTFIGCAFAISFHPTRNKPFSLPRRRKRPFTL